MSEPIKYSSVVNSLLLLYQNQLLRLLKRSPMDAPTLNHDTIMFRAKFERQLKRLVQMEDSKCITEGRVSQLCQPMQQHLNGIARIRNTSQTERYGDRSCLRTQDSHRMRLTGGLAKAPEADPEPIHESTELDDIIRSYKIQQQIGPRMRMKWKSLKPDPSPKAATQDKPPHSTIGDNNIDLLSYTIPEIENSIKRLSLQTSHAKHRSPERIFEAYRTVDTRSHSRKKYVQRLI